MTAREENAKEEFSLPGAVKATLGMRSYVTFANIHQFILCRFRFISST